MAISAYDPCPCGSGKKVRFCCQKALDEMDRIVRMRQNKQFPLALQHVEKVCQKFSDLPWPVLAKAELLMDLDRLNDARETLRTFLKQQPDHKLAIMLYAMASMDAEGYPASIKSVHRAFLKGAREFPEIASALAMGCADHFRGQGEHLAVRQHIVLALLFSSPRIRDEVLGNLASFDENGSLSYLVRGAYTFAKFDDDVASRPEIDKALRLSSVGCWQEAADSLAPLAESNVGDATLCQNYALMRAWSGNSAASIDSFHRLARLSTDEASAIQWEALAQQLTHDLRENRVRLTIRAFKIPSVSQLLTALDQQPQLIRLPATGEDHSASHYVLLDRPQLTDFDPSAATWEQMPRNVGQINVIDRREGEEFGFATVDYSGETAETIVQNLLSATNELWTETQLPEALQRVYGESTELDRCGWHGEFPEGITPAQERQLLRQFEQQVQDEIWPNTPLKCLGGKTPLQAAVDPGLRLPLLAAIVVLDAKFEREETQLDWDRLFTRLGLTPVSPETVDSDVNVGRLPISRLLFINVRSLSDDQILALHARIRSIRHSRLWHDVCREIASRPNLQIESNFLEQAYNDLIFSLCDQGARDDAFEWLARARLDARPAASPFLRKVGWKITELRMRLQDVSDPEIRPLLLDLWHNVAPKIPEYRNYLQLICSSYEIEPPWTSDSAESALAGSVSPGSGLWTPDSPAQKTDESSQKLWLPN